MVSTVISALFRPPLTDTNGKTAKIEEVTQLSQRKNTGVVFDSEGDRPIRELSTVANISRPHADTNHVLSNLRNPVDLHILFVNVKSSVHLDFVLSDTGSETSGHSRSLYADSGEAKFRSISRAF